MMLNYTIEMSTQLLSLITYSHQIIECVHLTYVDIGALQCRNNCMFLNLTSSLLTLYTRSVLDCMCDLYVEASTIVTISHSVKLLMRETLFASRAVHKAYNCYN